MDKRRIVVAAVLAAQATSVINQYNVPAVFALMAADLGQNVSGLGLISTTYVLGLGLFQVPMGILTARLGPKKILVAGNFIIGLSTALVGLAPNVAVLAVLRFITGAGEAFVFAPGVVLITAYMKKGSEGLGIGLFAGAFFLAGIFVIPGAAVLGQVLGWRDSLIVGGAIGVATSAMLLLLLPGHAPTEGFKLRMGELRSVLANRKLLLISIPLLGAQIGWNLTGFFMVFYLEQQLGIAAAIAGLAVSLGFLFSLLMAPLSGRIHDRGGDQKRVILAFGSIAAAGLAGTALGSLPAALVASALVGASSGGSNRGASRSASRSRCSC